MGEPSTTSDTPGQSQTVPTALAATGITASNPITLPATTAASAPAAIPTTQVAAALVQLSQAPSGQTLSLRLDPAELGHVQVRIDRGADGTASVHVSAERPETLRLLITDQAALHRTLDNAGVAQEGRSLDFSLATPGSGGQGSAGSGTGGFTGNGADGSGGQPGGTWRQDRGPYPEASASTIPASAWQRAGIDITA